MSFSKVFISALTLFSILGGGSQVMASSLLHCDGFGVLNAAIRSETNLTSLVFTKDGGKPDAENRSVTGRTEGHSVAFNVGNEISWGYILRLPAGYDKSNEAFKAWMYDYEPQDLDGTFPHEMNCSVVEK